MPPSASSSDAGPASRASTPPHDGGAWVSASALGSFAYCHRMYFLQKVRRVVPDHAGRERLAAGTRAHAAHGTLYVRQLQLRRLALRVLAGTAVLALLVWLATRLGGQQ